MQIKRGSLVLQTAYYKDKTLHIPLLHFLFFFLHFLFKELGLKFEQRYCLDENSMLCALKFVLVLNNGSIYLS